MTTTQIAGPDGVLRDAVVFSTTAPARFFTGTCPEGTVDLQVSVRGAAYTADPALVSFTGTQWTVPNPAAYPNGLVLLGGVNVVGVRALLLGQPPQAAATATVTLQADAGTAYAPPTQVTVEQLDGAVRVSALGVDDATVRGYNYYAATEAGGGTGGYYRINVRPVTAARTVQSATELYALTENAPVQAATGVYARVLVQQEDLGGAVLATDLDSRAALPDGVSTLQVNVTLNSLVTQNFYDFTHRRNATADSTPPTVPVGAFASRSATEPLYYVATAVYYDAATGVEVESYFSVEVVGAPLTVRIASATLPAVSRQQVLEDGVLSIYRSDDSIAVQPGAVIRDVFLDLFATEVERVRFILDYIYRASSFDTLLLIDDPNGTGQSVTPAASPYKTALAAAFYMANVNDVQALIDGAFDKLAGNLNVTRRAGTRAVTEVRFYTASIPTQTLPLALGTLVSGGGVQFRTVRASELPFDRLASYYNPVDRVYSVTVPVQAVAAGSSGNVAARQLTQGAPYGFSVVNDAAAFGGGDREANSALAARARRALAAVDTGTEQGIGAVAASSPGVVQYQVVRAGSPLMQRDYESTLGRHVGGCVDVWTQGVRAAAVSDTFAFTYEQKRDALFVLAGAPGAYRFQVVDDAVTPANPLSAMLDYPGLGLGLRNVTTGFAFDLTGAVYLNYNTIALDVTRPQPPVTLTDVVLGDFRYRTSTRYVFERQPVSSITSLTGGVTGTVDPSLYALWHPASPLGLGRSVQAGDYLQLQASTDPAVTSPSGQLIAVTGEPHVLTGYYIEYAFRLGVDSLSLVVTSPTGYVYRGPLDPSGTPDYLIVEGTATAPLGLRRTSTGTIADGATVYFAYSHDENFTVTYQVNLVTAALQPSLDSRCHADASALAKDAAQVPVDVTATVVLDRGYSTAQADTDLRRNLRYLISGLRLGQPLRRSEVIATLNNTRGVAYVIVPLTLMSRASGSLVVREDLVTAALGDSFRVDGWSTRSVGVWLVRGELNSPTTDGGGPVNEFRGVYSNDRATVLQVSSPASLGREAGRAYIYGAEGGVIPGYSDAATLLAEGYRTAADQAARRTAITRNRVLVSLAVGTAPNATSWWVTYVVGASTGDNDIVLSSAEYAVAGTISITYDESR